MMREHWKKGQGRWLYYRGDLGAVCLVRDGWYAYFDNGDVPASVGPFRTATAAMERVEQRVTVLTDQPKEQGDARTD